MLEDDDFWLMQNEIIARGNSSMIKKYFLYNFLHSIDTCVSVVVANAQEIDLNYGMAYGASQ